MIQKIKFIWQVLIGKESEWMFIKLTDKMQKAIIENRSEVDIVVRYVGVDKRVVKKLTDRMCSPWDS